MTTVSIFNRHGEPITSVEAWKTLASPGQGKWKVDYSAEALARAWIDGRGPEALLHLLEDHQFRALRLEKVTAEAQTHFDAHGGPRNHDLLIDAAGSSGPIMIGVEG